MSQCFRVDGDLFENAPRVDHRQGFFYGRTKKMRFQNDPETCGCGLIDAPQPTNFL